MEYLTWCHSQSLVASKCKTPYNKTNILKCGLCVISRAIDRFFRAGLVNYRTSFDIGTRAETYQMLNVAIKKFNWVVTNKLEFQSSRHILFMLLLCILDIIFCMK